MLADLIVDKAMLPLCQTITAVLKLEILLQTDSISCLVSVTVDIIQCGTALQMNHTFWKSSCPICGSYVTYTRWLFVLSIDLICILRIRLEVCMVVHILCEIFGE